MSAALAYFVLPAPLLIFGLPIFLVLLLTSSSACVRRRTCRRDAVQTYMLAVATTFPSLRCRSSCSPARSWGGAASRAVSSPGLCRIIGGVRGSLAVTTVASSELFGAMAHTAVGTVVAVGRLLFRR